MYKVRVLDIGFNGKNCYAVEHAGKFYRIDTSKKIGRRLIAFYKIAYAGRTPSALDRMIPSQFILEVPVDDVSDLYKLFPTKRGREIVNRLVEKCKKEGV